MSEVTFEPFQKVLVRDENEDEWHADFFSHIYDGIYVCVGHPWRECIPYNEETAHLLGTTDDPTPPEPEFRWGEHVEVRDDETSSWRKAVYLYINKNSYYCFIEPSGACLWKYCRHADW